MPTPQTPRRRRSHKGLQSSRAIATLGLTVATRSACALGAERSDGPNGTKPLDRAEKRSTWGGLAPQDASLRGLACRICLNGAR